MTKQLEIIYESNSTLTEKNKKYSISQGTSDANFKTYANIILSAYDNGRIANKIETTDINDLT